jgi:hypothetical protein
MLHSWEKPKYQRQIESELERALRALSTEIIFGEEYGKTLGCVERLYEMVDKDKPPTVSKDVWATVAANLIGIILVIKHENVNVITSKAFNLVTRPLRH